MTPADGTAIPGAALDVAVLDRAARARLGRARWVASLLASARVRAEAVAHLASPSGTTAAYAAEVALGLSFRAGERRLIGPAVRDLAGAAGADAETASWAALALSVRDPRLFGRSVSEVVEACLALLAGLAPVSGGAVWAVDVAPGLTHVGGDTIPRARRLAATALQQGVETRAGRLHALPLDGHAGVLGALTLRVEPGPPDRALAAAREATGSLTAVLERRRLVLRTERSASAIMGSAERRLARIGFDLHDGPLQDLALLHGGIGLLRRHLRENVSGRVGEILAGQADDLDARALALEGALRDFARSFESPVVAHRPFEAVLNEEVARFRKGAAAAATLDLEGDFDSLTPSRRIAVFRIVQEALSNVRQHSAATTVTVAVRVVDGAVTGLVTDDGTGFDVGRAIAHARSRGRIGLLGMVERARLLGGDVTVCSRPGVSTTVEFTLPGWTPPAGEPSES